MDAVVDTTRTQIDGKKELIAAGINMSRRRRKDKKLLDGFSGRWQFMRNLLENSAERR